MTSRPTWPCYASLGLLLTLAGCGRRSVTASDGAAAAGGDAASSSDAPGTPWDAAADALGFEAVCPSIAEWACEALDGGGQRCVAVSPTPTAAGLPPGGAGWSCHLRWDLPDDGTWGCTIPTHWRCYGTVATGTAAPVGCGWTCDKALSANGRDTLRCDKALDAKDVPPGASMDFACRCTNNGPCARCFKGSALGGTTCYVGGGGPQPPLPYPRPGETCEPGARRWCEDMQFDGWGIMTCKPDGSWPTKMVNGKETFYCPANPDGRRPDTHCACYHPYVNPACCELPDCSIPDDVVQPGRICQPSPGMLCDYCNPQKPECVEPGARCLVNNGLEAYCGRSCDLGSNAKCPAGFFCFEVKRKDGSGVEGQCAPEGLSCIW